MLYIAIFKYIKMRTCKLVKQLYRAWWRLTWYWWQYQITFCSSRVRVKFKYTKNVCETYMPPTDSLFDIQVCILNGINTKINRGHLLVMTIPSLKILVQSVQKVLIRQSLELWPRNFKYNKGHVLFMTKVQTKFEDPRSMCFQVLSYSVTVTFTFDLDIAN